jgi:hypothetical protein
MPVTLELLQTEYRLQLNQGRRPTHLFLVNPEGAVICRWEIDNSKALGQFNCDGLTSEASDGWKLSFNLDQDPFYIGE